MPLAATPARPRDRAHRRNTRLTERLTAALRREGLTLADVRRVLLPTDPWQAARGLWTDRKARARRAQQKLRREWDR